MTNKVEELERSASELRSQLFELRDNIRLSAKEKREQADTLKSKADALSREIDSELAILSASTDADAQANIEKLLVSQDILKESQDLYASILTSLESGEQEKEGFWDWTKDKYGKAKNWVLEQWHASTRENFQKEPGKTALRRAGFGVTIVGGGLLIFNGIRRLFSKETKEERRQRKTETKEARKEGRRERREARKQARKERREARRRARQERRLARAKLPFWERPIGKIIKYSAIGTLVYWIIHGIYTGKWGSDDIFHWGTEGSERAREQISKYKELSPEDREKYETLGEKVNEFYGNVRANEKSYGYESPYDLGTISQKINLADGVDGEVYEGLVPFCMDQSISNVNELLSEKNFTTYIFDKDTTEVIEQLKGWGASKLEKVLGPYVSNLKSFQVFNARPLNSLGEKIEAWLQDNSQERIDELNFFFRQYTKVLTYMKDKERSIAYKIAEEKCQSELSGKSEEDKVNFIQDKLADKDRFEENVQKDSRYQKFMSSKILNSGEALTNAGLFNGELSPILKEGIIEPLDNEFDKMMQVDEEGVTIVDKGIKEISDGTFGNQTRSHLVKMCGDLKDDIEDNNGNGGLFKGFSYIFNTKDSNKEKFLEESGLKDIMNELSAKIDEIKIKIENTDENDQEQLDKLKVELQKLKETALAYFAFQKEMEIAIYTLQSTRDDNPDYLRRFLEAQVVGANNFIARLNKIFGGDGAFGDYLVVGVGTLQTTLVLSSRARRAVGGAVIDATKRTAKKPIQAVKRVAGRPAFSDKGFREALERLSETSSKKSYFLHYALNGKVRNESILLDIAKNDLKLGNTGSIGDALLELLGPTNPGLTKADCELLWKYAGNSDIKKLVLSESIPDGKFSEMLEDGFKPGAREFKLNKVNFDELKRVDKLFDEDYIKSSSKAKKLLERMLSKSVHNIDDLKYIQELFIDDEFFKVLSEIEDTPKAIRHMAKHVKTVKGSQAFSTLTNEINKITTSGVNLPTKLHALEDYRRGLVVMEPKEFKLTNTCIELLGKGDFIDNMTIIEKLIKEGIDDGKYKIKIDDLTDEVKINKVIDNLRNASPKWKEAVFGTGTAGTTKFNKFIGTLDDFKAGKVFSNVDDLTSVLKKAVKLVGKLT